MNQKQIDLLAAWEKAQEEKAKWTAQEKGLRLAVAEEFFPEIKENKLTTFELMGGYKLKAKVPTNITVDKTALPSVIKILPKGTEDKVINYKPELKVSEYNKLSKKNKLKLDEALSKKPGLVSLEIVAPPPAEEEA